MCSQDVPPVFTKLFSFWFETGETLKVAEQLSHYARSLTLHSSSVIIQVANYFYYLILILSSQKLWNEEHHHHPPLFSLTHSLLIDDANQRARWSKACFSFPLPARGREKVGKKLNMQSRRLLHSSDFSRQTNVDESVTLFYVCQPSK